MRYFHSEICDRPCEHRHQTSEAAEKCAKRRVGYGELRRYMGDNQPLSVPPHELASLVREYNDGMRIGG